MLRFENLDLAQFDGAGAYNIPKIRPEAETGIAEWLPFNLVRSRAPGANTGAHFFVEDYRFTGLWTRPDSYIDRLRSFVCVLSPDFSLYADTPAALQIYNHYRKHWLAAYWQSQGVKVIPTIAWSTAESFAWCFDGEPIGGTVAVSSVGCMKRRRAFELFCAGYEEMLLRLSPSQVLFHGVIPPQYAGDKVVHIEPYYKSIERR